MTTFKLHATINVQGEGRMEEAYTYVTADKSRGVQFRFHSRAAFRPVILNRYKVSDAEIGEVVSKFVSAGFNQHDFAGGFNEAIQTL